MVCLCCEVTKKTRSCCLDGQRENRRCLGDARVHRLVAFRQSLSRGTCGSQDSVQPNSLSRSAPSLPRRVVLNTTSQSARSTFHQSAGFRPEKIVKQNLLPTPKKYFCSGRSFISPEPHAIQSVHIGPNQHTPTKSTEQPHAPFSRRTKQRQHRPAYKRQSAQPLITRSPLLSAGIHMWVSKRALLHGKEDLQTKLVPNNSPTLHSSHPSAACIDKAVGQAF